MAVLTGFLTSLWAQPQNTQSGTAIQKPLVKVDSRPLGSGPVLTGLDALKRDGFKQLRGKRIALLTNVSAIDREGNHILDLMFKNPAFELVTLFSPEHGLYGDLDTHVADFQDTRTGLMVHSLYSSKRSKAAKPFRPDPADLKGLDAVVIDMQDIGARYYTYISYMGKMLESCAESGIEAIVLDRPNPIGGNYVDGPQQDPDTIGGITSYFPMPIAHGMTMGELAGMFNVENKINCKLTIVPVENWTREMYLDETGLRWINPSPNIQDLEAALVYPGIAITEAAVSMGRGTTEPFHIFGSPMIRNSKELIDTLTSGGLLTGLELEPVEFTPTGRLAKAHAGENKLCRGARMNITDRKQFRPYVLGLLVMDYMYDKFGKGDPATTGIYKLWSVRGPASSWVCARIQERKNLQETLKIVDRQVAQFKTLRAKYLLYPKPQ
ncbi:MAG: exo-beta-N-acetylmuramidase NamZ family protein [Candidatus Sumerlaeaceae bacterium]